MVVRYAIRALKRMLQLDYVRIIIIILERMQAYIYDLFVRNLTVVVIMQL